MRRTAYWCCYQQSPNNDWCSCFTSSRRCLSLFWSNWAAAALPGESPLVLLHLWFVLCTLGEVKDHEHLQKRLKPTVIRYSVTYFTVLDSDHKVAVLHLYTWIYTPGLIYNNIIYNNKWFSSFSLTHSLHFCLLSVCVHMWASVFGFKCTGACVSWFHTKGPLGSRNATSSELLCSCAFQAS